MSTVLLDSAAATITIRSPLIGDERKIRLNAVYRRSRSGLIYGYKRTPEIQSLTLRYQDMNRPTINIIRAFIIAAVRPITLTLDNGDAWVGDILNDFTTAHASHANSPFTLLFEGVKSA